MSQMNLNYEYTWAGKRAKELDDLMAQVPPDSVVVVKKIIKPGHRRLPRGVRFFGVYFKSSTRKAYELLSGQPLTMEKLYKLVPIRRRILVEAEATVMNKVFVMCLYGYDEPLVGPESMAPWTPT